ncbi:DNA polymerase III subunit alpha [Ureaplasma urealyticum]|uniref:DNA polymerase III subunit alpha n=1 Tax=Ureaplasma urealyticum TaxID=2130 RepID=UPI001F3D75A2|nr:DNA polymerase III subunit alpha [Ureaplasma urealyticum]UIU14834.1 DNA polymerase III subunit alpha [Ureaplasma urealyticum]
METKNALFKKIVMIDDELLDKINIKKLTKDKKNNLFVYFNQLVDATIINELHQLPKTTLMHDLQIWYINDLKDIDQKILLTFFKKISEQSIDLVFLEQITDLNTKIEYDFDLNQLNLKIDNKLIYDHFITNKLKILNTLKAWSLPYSELEIHFENISLILNENHEQAVNEIINHHIQQQKQLEQQINQQLDYQNNQKSNFNYYKNTSNKTITKLIDINPLMNNAKIQAYVFAKKVDVLKSGAIAYKLNVIDDSETLTIMTYLSNSEHPLKKFLDELKIDQLIEAEIDIVLDNMSKSGQVPIGKIKKIYTIQDNHIKKTITPRLELNFHTKMSSLDAIISAQELIDFAVKNQLKTIGITDRNVVQSYPEIAKFSKKQDLKIIYGLETEELEEQIPLALNVRDQNLDDATYVIFDIETTGLFPNFDEIIEFGAIIMQNNKQIGDKIQFFVKPIQEINENITNLTNISQEMVNDAIDEKTALLKIKEIFANHILVAHNGISFDINFINQRLLKWGLEPLKNPSIDTLMISRAINPFKSHRLGAICKKYEVNYNDEVAHRADYDAMVLADVFKIMKNSLVNDFEIINLNQINTKLQSLMLKNRSFGNWVNLYIKTQANVKDMYELVSISHTDMYYTRPTITTSFLANKKDKLIISNSVHESDLINALYSKSDDEIKSIMQRYDFITLPSIGSQKHLVYAQKITLENVQKAFKKLVSLALESNKPIIYSSSPYYFLKDDKKFYDVYVNTKGLEGKSHRFANEEYVPDLEYVDQKSAIDELAYLEDENLINLIINENPQIINSWFDDKIQPLKEGLYAPKMEGVDQKTIDYVYHTAKKIYGDNLPTIVEQRIKKELDSIIKHGFSVVYWISHLLVEKSMQDGYGVGSRGSVGSSLVATFLNITDVNPLAPHYLCPKCKKCEFITNADDGFDLVPKDCEQCQIQMLTDGHNIPFETFLGFDGDKVPDIDLNFSGVYQAVAHNFIKSIFGETHSYRAGTIGTMAEKSAENAVKKYFENRFSENQIVRDSTVSLYVQKCIDSKRTTGQHPGGIIIVPKEYSIWDFSPYNFPANDINETWKTTHFAFEYLHDSLLKFDILGHDNPTILKLLKDYTGIDDRDVPMYDPLVMKLFSDISALNIKPSDVLNETTGAISIPEFGTRFVRGMLVDTKPKSFADLIRISGLSHGESVWLGNAQSLIKSGKLLKDVIACRDDIMTYLIRQNVEPKTAFLIMEDVRKGKKIKPEHQSILKELKIPEWYIESANKIKYMFPKAHATAYVMHAWKFAWYKIYHPLEYYAAFFSVRADNFDLFVINQGKEFIEKTYNDIEQRSKSRDPQKKVSSRELALQPIYEIVIELLARGFKISNISIEQSQATSYVIDKQNNAIIPPFVAIQGLGETVANSIIEARNQKAFSTIEDLKNRTKISRTDLKNLRELGVLDHLSETEQLTLF